MAGYYSVDHDDLQHPVFEVGRRPYSRWEAYCWLLDHATFQPQETTFRGRTIPLQRGQIAVSLGSLATSWSWQRAAVQRLLKSLQSARFISVSRHLSSRSGSDTLSDTPSDTAVTVITICSYSGISFQNDDTDTPPDTGTDTPREITPYMLSLKKEDKKERKERKQKKSAPEPRFGSEQPDLLGGDVIHLNAVDQERLALDAYNVMAARVGLSRATHLSNGRRRAVRGALKMLGGMSGWNVAMEKIAESEWITSGGWKRFKVDSILTRDRLESLMGNAYRPNWKAPEEHPVLRQAREYREEHPGDSFFNDISSTGTFKP